MTLVEILESDVKITEKLLRDNAITSHEVLNNISLSGLNTERFLSLLYIFKDNSKSNYLRFLIMFYNIELGNYEEAYKYAKYLYNYNREYKKDAAIYILMLEEILGKSKSNFELREVLLSKYDERFTNLGYQNQIRSNIYYGYYDKARREYKRLFCRNLNFAESTIYLLLKAIKNKQTKYAINCIEELNMDGLDIYFESKDCTKGTFKNQAILADLLKNTLYGIPVPKPKELPKYYDIYSAVEALDLDTIIRLHTDDLTVVLASKIKEVENMRIHDSYKGNLSYYLYDTFESIYENINSKDFTSAEDTIWNYLETLNKDSWVFYLSNLLHDLECSYDELTEEDITLRIAEIFDTIIEISQAQTKEREDILIEKYMAPKREIHPYSKVHEIDIEFNYNIPGIEEEIESVKNKTITYLPYASLESATEEDLFRIAILARENYRIGDSITGDNLIKLAEDLTKQSKIKSSELNFFIKAIKESKNILKSKEKESFVEEVKALLMK